MNLTQALDTFNDNLPEIKLACIENIKQVLVDEPEVILDGTIKQELMAEVRRLRVADRIEIPQRTIKRIVSRMTPPRAGQITGDDIARAKEFPVEELFDGQLFNSSSNKVGRCPFHADGQERTPSFTIRPDNTWRCFGCSEYGDSIDFYIKQNGLDPKKDFPKAVKSLISK